MIKAAAEAMNVSKSAMHVWVKQLKNEHDGIMPKATPMTADKLKTRELEQRIKRTEMEKDILKKATALLMSDSFNTARSFMN